MVTEYATDNRIIKIIIEMKTRRFASHRELLCCVALKEIRVLMGIVAMWLIQKLPHVTKLVLFYFDSSVPFQSRKC